MSNANLYFLPWVRQGAASAIDAEQKTGIASVNVMLTLDAKTVPVSVKLRGPADVIGIDANQVVRTDPRPGSNDFEPNCFPSIEFDRPDFPWLFTPAKALADNRLRPWLCLVVVRKQAGVSLNSAADAPLPVLTIAAPARPWVELPDLNESWAWAHAQVAADDGSKDAIRGALQGSPELSLSRLLCPRILAPDNDYIACVVPAFELGRKAGLGIPIEKTEYETPAPAWSIPPEPPTEYGPTRLPVYYHWEFRSGQPGDFESIARNLKADVPDGLGKRRIDISQPFPESGATEVELEGALLPISPPGGSPAPAPVPQPFRDNLAKTVNGSITGPDSDPGLAPPIYGRWYTKDATVDPAGATWLDQLNVDPRWRIAAAFGTRVVQEHQEALMASAWEQAAESAVANQRLRQIQLSLAVGESLHARHLSKFTEERMLRITAPAFARLRVSRQQDVSGLAASAAATAEPSLLAEQARSALPVAANRPAMRRIGRQRGPLTRRVAAQNYQRNAKDTWVARLNNMPGDTPPIQPPQPPQQDFCPIPGSLPVEYLGLEGAQPQKNGSYFGAFFVSPENTPVLSPGTPLLKQDRTEVPGFFRKAAQEHLNRFPAPRTASAELRLPMQAITIPVLAQTIPRETLPALVKAIMSTGDNVLAPAETDGVDTVMMAPHFPQPMYETLRDLSQELLLPGIDKVRPETVVGLETNRRFIEAYLVGLNHEMARELLWRGYPTDQRGTYFDRFWSIGHPDITALHTWSVIDSATGKMRPLGDLAFGAPPDANPFVMLLRSSLLQRYPNASVFMVRAMHPGSPPDPLAFQPDPAAPELLPIFSGFMQPDVFILGFDVSPDEAGGDPGYYVVIQEHPTEPRFGIDADRTRDSSHLSLGDLGLDAAPPAHAAQTAVATRRLPVRIAIHAKRLIMPA